MATTTPNTTPNTTSTPKPGSASRKPAGRATARPRPPSGAKRHADGPLPTPAEVATTATLVPTTPGIGAPGHAGGTPAQDRPAFGAPLWPTPLLRAQKMHQMLGQLITRSLNNQMATATVLPTRWDPQTWQEMSMIQQAVAKRVQQQWQDWVDGCQQIGQDYGQLKMANTLSKFVEQEYNVVAQFDALVNAQLSAWAGLMENIQVDYAYWISQKLPAAPGAQAAD